MKKAWRMVTPPYEHQAFDGQGAKLYGGRWNSKGTAMVYTASSLSLAAMEMLIHLEADEVLNRYVCIPIEFDAKLVFSLDPQTLPHDWRNSTAPLSTIHLGDQWVRHQQSAILEVPSALVLEESNFLINPAHPDFHQLSIGPSRSFAYDPRLIKKQ